MRWFAGWRQGAALAVVLAAAAAAWAGPPADRKPAGIGDVYLSLGGYMAGGDGASDKASTAYPVVFAKKYLEAAAGKPVPLLDLSKDEGSGDLIGKFIGDYRTNSKSESTLARVMKALAEAKAKGQRVSPLTVEMGGEDAFELLQLSEAEQNEGFARIRDELGFSLDEIADAVTDADGHRTADIVVTTYYNPIPDVPEAGALTARLNVLIRKMARVRGLAVADVDKAFAGKEANLLNGLVPNDDGHALVAEQVWKATGYAGAAAGN